MPIIFKPLALFVGAALLIGSFISFELPNVFESVNKDSIFTVPNSCIAILFYVFLKYSSYKINSTGVAMTICGFQLFQTQWSEYRLHEINEKQIEICNNNASTDSNSKYISISLSQIGADNFGIIKAHFEC